MSQLSKPFILLGPYVQRLYPLGYLEGVCTIYIKVKFEYLDLEWTNDSMGSGGPGDCDTTDAYYGMRLSEEAGYATAWTHLYKTRYFYGGGHYRPLKCGRYSFHDLADKVNPVLVRTVWDEGETTPFSELIISTDMKEPDRPLSILVAANFVDADFSPGNGDDWIVHTGALYEAPSFESAINYFGCGRTFVDDDEEDAGKSRLQYTVTVYPNACERTPDFGSTK